MLAMPEQKDQLEKDENTFFFLNKKTNSYVETGKKDVSCLYTHRHIAFMLGCGNVK